VEYLKDISNLIVGSSANVFAPKGAFLV
jgi:hypothetical protein